MLPKILSILSYLAIAGLLILLAMLLIEPRSGSDPSTRGVGRTMIILILAALVCLIAFQFLTGHGFRYLLLTIGLLCTAALVVILLALSGSSLVFQDTRQPYKPTYFDPVLDELFDAFQKGKVAQFKSLLQAHPDKLHNQELLKDVLYDAHREIKTHARKLTSLRYMLDSGARLDSSHCYDLSQCAYTGNGGLAELLLQYGADPNCIPGPGQKPVLFSTIEGYDDGEKLIPLLIRHGADTEIKVYDEERQDSLTPLLYAFHLEKWSRCLTLVENGASLAFQTREGVPIKDLILQKSSDPNNQGYSTNPDFLRLVKKVK